jgi:hypothetical protein
MNVAEPHLDSPTRKAKRCIVRRLEILVRVFLIVAKVLTGFELSRGGDLAG